ncbi:MAG TPA: hypothetical protein VK466_10700 [Terriglobales bacterium]|nr:hypothetical protein [Terriglobales bacterium]
MAIDGLKMRDISMRPEPQPPALDAASKDPGHMEEPVPDQVHVSTDLPKAPISDPLVAAMMKESLLQAKGAKIDAEINSIGNQMKEANQEAQNLMDAATTQMSLSVASGVANGTHGDGKYDPIKSASTPPTAVGGGVDLGKMNVEDAICLEMMLLDKDAQQDLQNELESMNSGKGPLGEMVPHKKP